MSKRTYKIEERTDKRNRRYFVALWNDKVVARNKDKVACIYAAKKLENTIKCKE